MGLFSLTLFVPVIVFWVLFLADALGRFLASLCAILFIANVFYIVLQICRKEPKLHLIPYTIFSFATLIMTTISYEYFYFLMCSQGT